MPASWAAHVCGPSSAAPGDSRVFCPDAEGQLIHTYTVTPTAALLHLHSQRVASSILSLQTYARSLSWTGTPPGLGILATWGPQGHAVNATAAPAQPQPQPESAHSPPLIGAWSAGIIDPRSWGFGSEPAHEYVVRTRASRLRTLRRIIAGLPDAVSSMRPAIWPAEYDDEHSGIRRLESRWAAAWSYRQQLQPQPDAPGPSRIRGAPDPSTDGCILLSLVQLQSETDAHRSHFLQHQPSRHSLRRDRACMPRYAAMTSTSLLWQRHILPALSGHTHGEPLRQLPWIGLDEWWPGVCCTASSSWEPSTGTSTEARRSHTSAHKQPARISWPASAMSCSAAQSPKQFGSHSDPAASTSTACRSCWQTTGVVHGSLPQGWTACGRDFACWSSYSYGTRTAAPGHGRSSRPRQRTSRRESSQQPGPR